MTPLPRIRRVALDTLDAVLTFAGLVRIRAARDLWAKARAYDAMMARPLHGPSCTCEDCGGGG